jgi:hypothetical protein
MSETRELFERFHGILMDRVKQARGAGLDQEAARIGIIGASVAEALDAPPPDAVPELPEWVEFEGGWYRVLIPSGGAVYLELASIERIAALRDILAARVRASAADEIPHTAQTGPAGTQESDNPRFLKGTTR